MSKITMAVVFGAGYVLGARAGHQRYEELAERAKALWNNPKVQKRASKVQEQVKQRLPGSIGGSSESGEGSQAVGEFQDNSRPSWDSDSDTGMEGLDIPGNQRHG